MKKTFMLAPLLAMAAASAGCAAGAGAASSPQPIRDGAATAALGGHARFGGLDVIPLRIEEDSRCPASVQCIQAGTVRLAVRIDDRGARSESVLSLGRQVELAGGWLTLAVACPYPAHPGPIARDSYLFTFIFALPGRPPPLVPACAS
jgi:hypothetical protein